METIQIDSMSLVYLVVGFFALVGFFRGWWKEALATLVLAFLMLLLQRPDWAQSFIDLLNRGITAIWRLLAKIPGVPETVPFQFEATSAGSWILLLILLLGLATLIARLALPGTTNSSSRKFYTVSIVGRLLGVLLGALNGFLIVNLIREYLDGRALPGNTPVDTEITMAGTSAFGPASSILSIQAVNLPTASLLDSNIPWLIMGIGFLIFLGALLTRVQVRKSKKSGGRKIVYTPPFGYEKQPK